jgi:hypothetical protein
VIDFDGTVACVADPLTETTYHAGHRAINHHSIGIEMYQGESAELYQVQLESTVRLVDFLTRRFGIQRQFHWPYHTTRRWREFSTEEALWSECMDTGKRAMIAAKEIQEKRSLRSCGAPVMSASTFPKVKISRSGERGKRS